MANFVAIVDPDTTRRLAFVKGVRERIAFLPGLTLGGISAGACSVVWAAGERAPVDMHADDGVASVVWGDAHAGSPSVRVSARELARLWSPACPSPPPAFDGFHAALRYDDDGGLTVGADLFGIFPVCYAEIGGTLLVGSSPQLFALHPLHPAVLDEGGLVGLLLAYGTLEGRTLLRHTRRLAPGCVLRWSRGVAAEVRNHRIVGLQGIRDWSFAEQVAFMHEGYQRAIARHLPPGDPFGILLSGGRDTRMLCGYLGERTRGVPAVTLGRDGDYEARCAASVARALGVLHRVVEPSDAARANEAKLQARWEHLASGFSNVHMWSALEPLRELPPHFLTGYLRESLDFAGASTDFDTLFATSYQRGFLPGQLTPLLGPALRDLVAERWSAVRRAYEGSADDPEERPWRFQLVHYARTHPGGVPWRLAFASWPVLPILDRDLLSTIASLGVSAVSGRRAQDAILRDRFPALARLPLDRNDYDTEPLRPSVVRHRLNPYLVKARRTRARLLGRWHGEREARYYYRLYDVNGAAWRAIRMAAEPFRECLAGHFDMDALARILPPPTAEIPQRDVIHDGFRPKTLLGLMLWFGEQRT